MQAIYQTVTTMLWLLSLPFQLGKRLAGDLYEHMTQPGDDILSQIHDKLGLNEPLDNQDFFTATKPLIMDTATDGTSMFVGPVSGATGFSGSTGYNYGSSGPHIAPPPKPKKPEPPKRDPNIEGHRVIDLD